MLTWVMKFSKQRQYRPISVAFLVASLLVPALLSAEVGWEFMALAAGLPFYVVLIALTYARFRDASISSLWLLPMVFIFHVGPKWEIGPIGFYPSGFISFLPVVIGWIARDGTAKANSELPRQGLQ